MLTDIRYTIRSARRTLALTIAAITCVAAGTAGAVFIFTIANAVLRESPPFPDAERLVRVWAYRNGVAQRGDLSYLDAMDLRTHARSFANLELAARTRAALTTVDGTERVRGESVTPGYFATIGQRAAVGRLFTQQEFALNANRVIVISHSLWVRKFGQRNDIVGQTVTIRGSTSSSTENNQLFTVVGVMPPRFTGTVDTDVSEFWLPIEQYTPRMILEQRSARATWVLARLKPGVTVQTAHAEVLAIGRQLAREYPNDYRELTLGAEPVGETWRERFRAGLRLLVAAAALLLVIACTNIAHLFLARLAQRENELRLRVALGASRIAIVRQFAVESVLLAVIGGVIGTVLAMTGVRMFAAAEVFNLPPYISLGFGAGTPLIVGGIIVCAALASAALPAWLSARVDASHHSRTARSAHGLGKRQRLSIDALVSAEVAFSFVLLTAALLMVRSYGNLTQSDVGFRTDNLQRLAITLNPVQFPNTAARLNFGRDVSTALAQQPGVQGVSVMAGVLPPWFDEEVRLAIRGTTRPELAAVARHAVDDAFFNVMEVPVREGRNFEVTDLGDSRRVAIVSRSLAHALASGSETTIIGSTVQVARQRDTLEAAPPVVIVGIVDDVKYHGPRSARVNDFDLYVPLVQAPGSMLSIAVATSRDPRTMLPDMQRTLGTLAPTSPVHWVSTMHDELNLQFTDARLYAWLTGVFGGSALLLVTIGIYGLVSNAVTRRFAELGVRMAVGAQSLDIVKLVFGQALRPVLAGIVLGAVATLAFAQLARALVYNIAPTDAGTYAAVSALIVFVGVGASFFPARRAVRLDPRSVLQHR